MSQEQARDYRQRVESLFERWGRFVTRRPWAIIAVCFLATGVLAARIPDVTLDNSTDAFLHPDDPVRITYDDFRLEFGRDAFVTVAIEARDVFAPAFLRKLAAFHEEIERDVPHVEDLVSLINARNTRGEGDELVVGELLEEWPASAAEFEALRERVSSHPIFRNTLVSEDATLTTLSIKLYAFETLEEEAFGGFDEGEPTIDVARRELAYLPEPEASAAVGAVREVMARHDGPDFRTHLAGGPVMSERLNAEMNSDLQRSIGLTLLSIGLLLYLLFRRFTAVVLPLLVVGLAVLATVGIMAIAGTPLSIGTQMLPTLLLAVGVCDSVHLLAIYYRRIDGGDATEDAIPFALGHSGLPIVMTSLTTAGGLGAFAVADLAPVSHMGTYAPIGVVWALVFSVALLPALLVVFPSARESPPEGASHDRLDRVLQGIGTFAADRPVWVLATTAALLLVAAVGASRLVFTHDPLSWFPEGDPLRTATDVMDEHLAGATNIEVIVDTGVENGLHDPARLDRLERVHDYAATVSHRDFRIEKTISLVDIVKEIHEALNENDPAFRVIPRGRQLVAQELLLFENSGSDDLEDFTDPQFRQARVTLRVPWTDAAHYPELLDQLEVGLSEILDGADARATGLLPMLAKTFVGVNRSMARSYVSAMLVITPLMILLIGSFRLGLLSMIPNLTPILLVLGCMGWAGLGINATTMMVGATVIGLAVDDTIHFMHNFRRYYKLKGDARESIRHTLATTGRALLVTSLVLTAGFLTFASGYMKNLSEFGLLTGFTIAVAFVSNVLLASALMVLATRKAVPR